MMYEIVKDQSNGVFCKMLNFIKRNRTGMMKGSVTQAKNSANLFSSASTKNESIIRKNMATETTLSKSDTRLAKK